MNETAPETADGALVFGGLPPYADAAMRLAEVFSDAPKPIVVADLAKRFLAALRDAGWVDPEEAARLRERHDLTEDWHSDRRCGEHVEPRCPGCVIDELQRQRDALLPVVEAARAYGRAWDVYANPSKHPDGGQEWQRQVAKAEAHQRLLVATRTALDSGTREESTDG